MATHNGGLLYNPPKAFQGGALAEVEFSGIVTVDGAPAARRVIGINTLTPDRPVEVVSSGVDGTWSMTIRMHPPETARIICVGETGENSEIYEHLVE